MNQVDCNQSERRSAEQGGGGTLGMTIKASLGENKSAYANSIIKKHRWLIERMEAI